MRTGIIGDLEQRHEYVVQNFIKIRNELIRFENITLNNVK